MTEDPPLQTVGPADRCQLQQLNLAFCGPFVNFPITATGAAADTEDRNLARRFVPVEEYIRTIYGNNSRAGDRDSAAADGCVAAIQREWCLTAFEMCEGNSAPLEYCWHSHPTGQFSRGCQAGAFACSPGDDSPAGEQPVVCGMSPWGGLLLCVREGGGDQWSDLFPDDASGAVERAWGQPACAALSQLPDVHSPCEQTSCTGHGKERERCYDRRITSDGSGGLIETFFAAGEDRPEQTLWVTRPAGNTMPPSPPATLNPAVTPPRPDDGTDEEETAEQCLDLTDPSAAYGLLGQLSTAGACSSIVQLLTAQAMPLLATPEAIPAVLYGMLDTHTGDFCRCMAGLPADVVGAFFPTPGCKLGQYAASDLMSLCAAAGVDTTTQLCNRGCQPAAASTDAVIPGPIELGDPDRGICCVCSAGGAVAGCGSGSSPGSVQRPENGTVTHPATDNSARTGKVVGALVLMVVFVVAMGYFTVWRRRGTARMQFGTRNHYDEKVELLDVLWDSGESDSEEVYARHTFEPAEAASAMDVAEQLEVDLSDENNL